jgi:NDP-sugar pyrophosphorylase family protein
MLSGGNLAGTTAAILAGGLGTRLRSAVADRPKVLAEVRGRPFLARLLDQVVDAGATRVVLLTGYRAEMIEQAFGTSYRGVELVHSPEPGPLGTGGAIRLALPHLASKAVLLLNGDSYCDVDLRAFHAAHVVSGAETSLTLVQVPDTSRYGRVELDAHDRVLAFVEKGGEPRPGWINAGVYLLDRRWIEAIPADRAASLEREVFAARVGQGLHGFRCGGRFLDIGTPESYREAERFFAPRDEGA